MVGVGWCGVRAESVILWWCAEHTVERIFSGITNDVE